jgi:hypothetical protein
MKGHRRRLGHYRYLPQIYVHCIQKLGQMSLGDRERLLQAKWPPVLKKIGIISDTIMVREEKRVQPSDWRSLSAPHATIRFRMLPFL